ncbi:Disease resistance protein RPM1 [Morus notabilis]|uniref:Disease resistance protein RPM1 n=1 Tax=Morus notabilis TaxID=981085 RepID=W9RQ75_9ROSA|nr:Disease resistance protein RPM1 [Morus notabilis]
MAETFLSPVIEKLLELLIEEAKALKGVRKEVERLKDELEIIQPFLRDAEAKLEKGEVGDATKVWLKQIRNQAERIENVVDEYLYHAEQNRCEGGFITSLRKVGHCIKALRPRYDIASEIEDIKEVLGEIKDRGIGYGLRPLEHGARCRMTNVEGHDPRLRSLFMEEDEIICIDGAFEELMRRMTAGPSLRSVTSLVGQGGIGKTTLARVGERIDEDCTREELISLLKKHLQTKRYVIVFDDVWQRELWELMKFALPNNDKGSRIIITTRNVGIADYCNENRYDLVQELQTWSSEMAWKLFCKKAFRSGEFEGCSPKELEQLSHAIIRKCHGLPLAISTIAGLLSTTEKVSSEWRNVLNNLNSEYEKTDIPNILSLSYLDLPYHLKLCFLYFGIFPEDFQILDVVLYNLWIAEGFVKERKNMTLEDVAKEYLNELIQRNLVLFDIEFGVIRACKVRDLMHDSILTRAGELCSCQTLNQSKSSLGEKSHRVSIHDTTENVLERVRDSGIRSVFLFNVKECTKSFLVDLFENFKLLKVLEFQDSPLSSLPREVGNLFHLKYLCLGGTEVKVLPKSIGKLRNLQTLDVQNTLVRELPVEVNKLRNLRHLLANSFDEKIPYSLETYCGMLKKLKSLDISKVTAEMGMAFGLSIEKLKHLEVLYLNSINEDEVLDLKYISSPPPLLRYLELNCRLQQLPKWISEIHNLQGLQLNFSRLIDEPLQYLKGLPNLAFLDMYQTYEGDELHFEEDGFQKLKQLKLCKLGGLKMVKIDRKALPLLEKFDFGPCPLMKQVPSDIQHLTNLKSLGIYDMPREFVVCLQPDGGADYCQIRHVPSVTFHYYRQKRWSFDDYNLGSSDLLKLLQEQVS